MDGLLFFGLILKLGIFGCAKRFSFVIIVWTDASSLKRAEAIILITLSKKMYVHYIYNPMVELEIS